MRTGLKIVLVVCGSCLVAVIPVLNALLNWRVIRALENAGEGRISLEPFPMEYVWAMFALGAIMILVGAWSAWSNR